MKQRRNEQGGVLSFVLVGVLLTLLLVGGIWLAKNQARTARTTDVSTSESQPVMPETTDRENESSGSPSTTDTETTDDETSVAVTGPSEAESLPSTGPEDIIIPVLVLAGLCGGLYAHTQSSRRLARSALELV